MGEGGVVALRELHVKVLRRAKRKFSISAPRLAVRPHLAWYVRWAFVLPVMLVVGALIWWAYTAGLELAGFHRSEAQQELSQLHDQIATLKAEAARLASQSAGFERQTQMEHAANLEVAKQLKALNEDNIRLQEDLGFFQNLPLSGGQEDEISIHRYKVEHDTLPGEYRYRLLLVRSGAQRARRFHGSLQLRVNALNNGQRVVMVFPQEGAKEDETYQLNFKYYVRIEHSFQLPPDMVVESVQARVFERGTSEPRVKLDAGLS